MFLLDKILNSSQKKKNSMDPENALARLAFALAVNLKLLAEQKAHSHQTYESVASG